MASRNPRLGFVSLGRRKALVDSERILTQLRAEGYDVAPTCDAADLVVVNTCGFIDEAVHESLDAIGEALAQNGRVIVTGCLGAKPEKITERHPAVLKVTGPQAYEEVVGAVLGDLASRPIDRVLNEAVRLRNAGVRELLVISQDTSAYGADLGYRAERWGSREIPSRFIDLARELGEIGPWVRLHYVYPYPHVDAVEGDTAVARSEADAPEIDGVVRVRGAASLPVGEFADVMITGAAEYDLEARLAS